MPLRFRATRVPPPLVIVTTPVRRPVPVGEKVTLMVQLAPGARLLPQVLVWLKSPLIVTAIFVMTPLLVLVRVAVWTRLAVFTA